MTEENTQPDAKADGANTPPAAKASPETTDAEAQAPEATEQPDNAQEARKYRKRAQEAEAERDALAEKLDTLRRGVIEDIAGDMNGLERPAGLWLTGVTVADLLDADGNVDAKKVKQNCDAAINELGLQRRLGNYAPLEGGNPSPPRATSMLDVMMGHDNY